MKNKGKKIEINLFIEEGNTDYDVSYLDVADFFVYFDGRIDYLIGDEFI